MEYKYDIAISYQSNLEKSASRIADYLQAEGLNVFFAPAKQREMLSEKLHQKLYDVYKNQSLIKVLLITESYLKGEWTSLEMRMSLDSTKNERKRLIIINYMGMDLPNNLKSFVYLNGKELHEDQLASIIAQRLRELQYNAEKTKQKTNTSSEIRNNHGIITGDNAHFGEIHFN